MTRNRLILSSERKSFSMDLINMDTIGKIKSVILGAMFTFLISIASMQGQTLNYKVYVNGHESGVSEVSRVVSGENDFQIEVKTDLHVKLMLSIHFQFDGTAVFENGILKNSEVSVYNNDHLHSNTVTTLKGDTYEIVKDKKAIPFNKSAIICTGYNLYFEYPKGYTSVYSISEGRFDEIKFVNDREISIVDKKGHLNTYTYNEDGIVKSLKLHHSAYEIQFILSE